MKKLNKIQDWIHDNIEMPWHEWLCSKNYHRKVWTRWDGLEHCHCNEMVVDKDDYYTEI